MRLSFRTTPQPPRGPETPGSPTVSLTTTSVRLVALPFVQTPAIPALEIVLSFMVSDVALPLVHTPVAPPSTSMLYRSRVAPLRPRITAAERSLETEEFESVSVEESSIKTTGCPGRPLSEKPSRFRVAPPESVRTGPSPPQRA